MCNTIFPNMKDIKNKKVPTVLSIAGFDGSGGAGLQADSKTISSLGCYPLNVISALPVQNTQGVRSIYNIPKQAVLDQLNCLFDDTYPDAIKIGMIPNIEMVEIISYFLKSYKGIIIYDPVMVSSSGHKLMKDNSIEAIKTLLFPITTLITPNLDEISVLLNKQISKFEDMEEVSSIVLELGANAILMKSGHLKSELLTSILIEKNKTAKYYHSIKIETNNTHGTGCTLSSAIASYMALGESLPSAVGKATEYVNQAILYSKELLIGKGNGPLNHFFNPNKLISIDID